MTSILGVECDGHILYPEEDMEHRWPWVLSPGPLLQGEGG